MKKILSLALVISGISFGAFAQEGGKGPTKEKKSYVRKEHVNKKVVKLTPEQIAEKRTERLNKDLNLTSAQRDKVYKLNLDQAKSFEKKLELRKKERELERKERLAQREKFTSILTPEQKSVWKEKYISHAKKRHNNKQEKVLKFRRGGVQLNNNETPNI